MHAAIRPMPQTFLIIRIFQGDNEMRLNRHTRHMIILTAAVCLIAIFAGFRGGLNRKTYDVALVPRKGMTILSENPVQVKHGKSAAFQVQFDENCFHNDAGGLRYENGVLYVDNVLESKSVHYVPRRNCLLSVRSEDAGYVEFLTGNTILSESMAEIRVNPPEHYSAGKVRVNEDVYSVPSTGVLSFQVYDDSEIAVELEGEPVDFSVKYDSVGMVRNLQEREEYRYGDSVTLRAEYDSAYVRFDGWSANAYLDGAGTLLSAEPELSLTLSGDTGVFANFTDLHTYAVTVDPNGGKSEAVLTRGGCSAGKPVYLPADIGALYREGYALIGYNTLADGSGQHISLASPMMMGRADTTVYAEWMQETPADALAYGYMDGFVVLQGTTRDTGDTLVIPASIDGVALKAVDINAFAGNAALKTVVIPLGVTHIGDGAFSNCPNLSMVYLPDTLEYMSGSAFDNCPSFQHMRVLAGTNTRVYEKTFDSALADRYMRLTNTEGKRIILVAGSSGSFGLNSNLLAERYPDYEIINFSGSYLYGIMPMLFYVIDNIHEGDVVIFAPEYYKAMYANGQNSEMTNWMYLESNYNMLDDLNLQIVRKSILNTFVTFLDERRDILPKTKAPHGVYARSAFNEYGDLASPRTKKKDSNDSKPDLDIIGSACVQNFSAVFREITARGGVCLFSFPPVSSGDGSPERLKDAYDAFTKKLTEAFAGAQCTVISSAADYVFPADAFYDSRYHMNSEGAKMRTNQLIADLDAYGLGR